MYFDDYRATNDELLGRQLGLLPKECQIDHLSIECSLEEIQNSIRPWAWALSSSSACQREWWSHRNFQHPKIDRKRGPEHTMMIPRTSTLFPAFTAGMSFIFTSCIWSWEIEESSCWGTTVATMHHSSRIDRTHLIKGDFVIIVDGGESSIGRLDGASTETVDLEHHCGSRKSTLPCSIILW